MPDRSIALNARPVGDHEQAFAEPVVLQLSDELLTTLRHKTRTFQQAQREDPETSAHEYLLEHSPLALPVLAAGSFIDWPDAPCSLEVLEQEQKLTVLTHALEFSYLAVSESGFSFLWNGSDETHGPQGILETKTLTLGELERF